MKMNIFSRVLIMVVVTVMITSAGVFWTSKYFMDEAFDVESREAINSAKGVVESHVENLRTRFLHDGLLVAANQRLTEAVLAENRDVARAVLAKTMTDTAAHFVTVCDRQGVVLARSHSDKVGDNVASQPNVAKALGGEPNVGIETGSVIKFSLRSACPIVHDGRVVGAVQLGVSLSETGFVDAIKAFSGLEVTLFEGDTRLTTTLVRDGKRVVGTKMDNPAVLDAVLAKGGVFLQKNTIFGKDYETAYWPIVDVSGAVKGMYFIGKPLDHIVATKRGVTVATVGVSLGLAVIMICVGAWFALSLSRPISRATAFAATVAEGNLEETLMISDQGEIGVLANALRTMVANLKDMIAQAQAKTMEAEDKSRQAEEAKSEAEAARRQAEEARHEGMLDAASRIELIVERVTSASEQLAAQIEQSSRGSEIQRQRMAEASAAVEEMNASVLEVARNASDAASNAEETREQAQQGAGVVRTVIAAINDVQALAAHMKESLGKLGDQATGIGRIMDMISDIADQTNLLALNAAIEAARAGDAGRGFAVVADEVRKLAEKTMSATKEVGEAIGGIQARATENIGRMGQTEESVRRSTHLAEEAGDALVRIVGRAESTADQVRAIATASEEQSAVTEEINRTTEDVNHVATETAEAMVQSAQAVADLARMSQDLRKLVDELKRA